jgi:hypothetical protein
VYVGGVAAVVVPNDGPIPVPDLAVEDIKADPVPAAAWLSTPGVRHLTATLAMPG